MIEHLVSNIEGILLNGAQLILSRVFTLIGFGSIDDDILKQLVIARLSQPMSKLATVEYLKSHFDEDVQLHKVYRYLDKLYNTQKDKVQQISVNHTKKVLGGKVGLMFYDVTKGTIELRPMFHFSERRIEAHVCICFVAFKVYKELERILKSTGIDLSVDKVLGIAKTIATLKVKLPLSGTITHKTMILTQKQKEIAFLFDENFWKRVDGHFG